MVHGLSVVAISVEGPFSKKEGERSPVIGAETDPIDSMVTMREIARVCQRLLGVRTSRRLLDWDSLDSRIMYMAIGLVLDTKGNVPFWIKEHREEAVQ